MGTIGASLGSSYSFLMRIELGIPGYVLLENNFHDYNVWITAHGVIMIFHFKTHNIQLTMTHQPLTALNWW